MRSRTRAAWVASLVLLGAGAVLAPACGGGGGSGGACGARPPRHQAAAADTPVLLLSAGDVMMGSLFHAAYAQAQAPDYLAMTFLGYDFVTFGNHEFDFGPNILASAIDTC